MKLLLAAMLVSAGLIVAPAGHAAATPQIKEIFCKIGYHRVLRHHPPPDHYVCVKNTAPADHPPECVLVKVAASDRNTRVWLDVCGTGGQGESPLLDQLAGELPLIVDGAGLRGVNCGWHASPCVIFWSQSPVEGAHLREP